jgi:hypothetical protein
MYRGQCEAQPYDADYPGLTVGLNCWKVIEISLTDPPQCPTIPENKKGKCRNAEAHGDQ